MELIIKPTSKCNFKCTFCSAGNLNILKSPDRVPDKIRQLVLDMKPDTVIITGGDPLCVHPAYYDDLMSLGNFNVSLTTNLKSFYINPDKWIPLFLNPRVGVTTSFQYGNDRMWDSKTVYTEDMFMKVMNLFSKCIGYMPMFISVTSHNNYNYAIKTVELAKRLGTRCKINQMLGMGLSSECFPKYKMVDIWLEIIDRGLWDYIDHEVCFESGGCGLNTSRYCESTIRSCWVDSGGSLILGSCEDLATSGRRIIPISQAIQKPIQKINNRKYINENCYSCELCFFCNGCESSRIGAMADVKYCDEMKLRKDRILKSGWKLQ